MGAEQEEERGSFISRVYSYSLVHRTSETVKGYYNYAKESSTYVKSSLETAEQYSQIIAHKVADQPTIESLLHKADDYGCAQLDKIEQKGSQIKQSYNEIKPKTYQSLDNAANKIHGTSIEIALLKTAGLVDGLVDSLFPPGLDESSELSAIPTNPNLVSRTAPIINKLKERVSVGSLKHLPARTYHISLGLLYQAESLPLIHSTIGLLASAALTLKTVSDASAQVVSNEWEKAHKTQVAAALQTLLNNVITLSELLRKLNATEARVSVNELVSLIQNKLEDIDVAKWREEISSILAKASTVLKQQVALGGAPDDVSRVRQAVQAIEEVVSSILAKLASPSA